MTAPVCYKRNTRMKVTAKFILVGPLAVAPGQ